MHPSAIVARANTMLSELRRLGDYDTNARPIREAYELIAGLAEQMLLQQSEIRHEIEALLDRGGNANMKR